MTKHGSVGSNFGRHFLSFRRRLLDQPFADRIVVVESQDLVATGRFDVVIRETKERVHCTEDGIGWPTDPEKEALLLAKINSALKELDMKLMSSA